MSENRYLQWLTRETPSVYWHDSAVVSELDTALQNGACGLTTNPFLIASTLKAQPEFWRSVLPGVNPDIRGDARAQAWTAQTAAWLAERVHPLYTQGGTRGGCCAQTNPARPGDAEATIAMAKAYGACCENVVIKVPATRAGLEAMEECMALGMNVAATVSFTVAQALAAGEAAQRGQERARKLGIKPGLGIAVIMVGRLDDYLRDVAQDTRAKVTEADIVWAGTAAIKRAYRIFKERGYACKLMPAAARGNYHITRLAGADMILSISHGIAAGLAGETDFTPHIGDEVDPAVLSRLLTMPEFVKAYEPDGIGTDEFLSFGPCNRTLDQFVQCGWNTLKTLAL